jgi:hypothetical protein
MGSYSVFAIMTFKVIRAGASASYQINLVRWPGGIRTVDFIPAHPSRSFRILIAGHST